MSGLTHAAFVRKLLRQYRWDEDAVCEAEIAIERNPGRWIPLNGLQIRTDGTYYWIREG